MYENLVIRKSKLLFYKKPFLLPTSGLMWFIIFKCTGKECDYSCVLRNELIPALRTLAET